MFAKWTKEKRGLCSFSSYLKLVDKIYEKEKKTLEIGDELLFDGVVMKEGPKTKKRGRNWKWHQVLPMCEDGERGITIKVL